MKARPARGLIAGKMATMGTAACIKNQRCSAMVNRVQNNTMSSLRVEQGAILNLT